MASLDEEMASLDEELRSFLREELQSARLRSARVDTIALERGIDSDGNPALFVNLTLADPPEGKETWPADDVRRLRRLVRDAILRLLQDDVFRWYVSFELASAEPVTEDAQT